MSLAEPPAASRHYTIQALIGEGAYGKVYKASMDTGSGFKKQVALKMLHPFKESEGDTLQRTRDEARLLGMLNHRAIVKVNALAYIANRWTMVMDHMEGLNLHQIIYLNGDDRPPASIALSILVEIASALHYAHCVATNSEGKPLGLLHRDLKPSNLMLTASGEIAILDFGTARADFEGREAATRRLQLGTEVYMAPEYRDACLTSPAIDIFSLGATTYELLCGQRYGRTPLSVERYLPHRDKKLEILRTLLGPQSWDLLALLSEMLAHDPHDRPSAKQVEHRATELLAAQREGPTLSQWAGRVVPLLLLSGRDLPTDNLVGRIYIEQPPPAERQHPAPTLELEAKPPASPGTPPRLPAPSSGAPSNPPALEARSGARSLSTPPPPELAPGEPPPPPEPAKPRHKRQGDEDPEADTDPLHAAQQAIVEGAAAPAVSPQPPEPAEPASAPTPAKPTRRGRPWLPISALAGLTALAIGAWQLIPQDPADPTPTPEAPDTVQPPPEPLPPPDQSGTVRPLPPESSASPLPQAGSRDDVVNVEPGGPAVVAGHGASAALEPSPTSTGTDPDEQPPSTPAVADPHPPGSATDVAPGSEDDDHAAAGAAGSVCYVMVNGLEGAYLEEPDRSRRYPLNGKVPAGQWILNGAFPGGPVTAIRDYTIQGDWSTAVFDCTGDARRSAATCSLSGGH